MAKFQFKMADGRHVAKCWKRNNSPTNGPIWMKLGQSHPIISPICPPWHIGGHMTWLIANECLMRRCLATAIKHSAVMGIWRPNAWANFDEIWVHNNKLGPQWQSRDQILFFFKFKMAAGRYVVKYWKCHNAPPNGLTWRKCRWSHSIMFTTCPPWYRWYGNGRCLATAQWTFSSYGHLEAERVNQ